MVPDAAAAADPSALLEDALEIVLEDDIGDAAMAVEGSVVSVSDGWVAESSSSSSSTSTSSSSSTSLTDDGRMSFFFFFVGIDGGDGRDSNSC